MKKRRSTVPLQMLIVCVLISGSWGLTGCGSREKTEGESTSAQEASAAEPETEESTISQPETEEEPEAETEPETEPYVSPIDFEELWEINPEVIGWIKVEGTNIDYPILYGPDNEKYLHTDLEGNTTTAGSIFLDCDDQPDFSSFHNVLYGHHMKNGSMFKDVVYYKEQDFFDTHKEIVLYTPEREIHLRPLAALYTSADPIRRKTFFRSWKSFKTYVKAMTADALTSAAPECPIGRLYSLVTCSYEFNNARTILYAYEVGGGTGESEQERGAKAVNGTDGGVGAVSETDGGAGAVDGTDGSAGAVDVAEERAGAASGTDGGLDGERVDMESWERYWATEEKTYRKRIAPHPALLPET